MEPLEPGLPGWHRVEDRWNRYAVELPAGWRVVVDGERFVAVPADDQGAAVVFWPLSLAGSSSLDAVTLHVVRTLANGERDFEAWTPPSPAAEGSRRVLFRRRAPRGAMLVGEVVVTPLGAGAAVARAYQYPADRAADVRPVVQRIAGGFALTEGLARERFVEPAEQAFALEYPRGWHASGGVDRGRTAQGGGVVVWCVEDPASRARVQQQGVTIPVTVPGPLAAFTGGIRRPYCDAPTFCREVLFHFARRGHPDLRLERLEPSPAVEAFAKRSLAPVERQLGASATVSGCLVWSTYTEDAVAFRECAVVTTWIVPRPPDPMAAMVGVAPAQAWFGTVGPTFRAPAAVFEQYLPVLRGIADSVRANDAWEQREVGHVASAMAREAAAAERQRAQTVRETMDYVHQVQRDIAARHAATTAEIARVGYNTVLGKEDVLDADGRAYKVDTGFETYWARDDRIVGSSSSEFDAHLESDGWRKLAVF